MKSIIILFAFTFFVLYDTIAQNPLGVYLDIDGKVKFWEGEANRNGNVDDSVYVAFKGKKDLIDLRNLKYDYLTLLEAPRYLATSVCNMNPSIDYDTLEQPESDSQIDSISSFTGISQAYFYIEPIIQNNMPEISSVQKQFMDEIRGAGLNDSIIREVKTILVEYINRLTGKWEDDDEREKLHAKLSRPDTIIEHKAAYDFLVDLFVVHNYDSKNRLTKVIGYHWNLGVEVDSLNYDTKGNLIYFCRDKIGSIRHEYYFEYNKNAQVENVRYIYSTVGANRYTTQYAHPEIRKLKFTYNDLGIMNSQSQLQKDGSWLTTYYDIR